MVSVYSVTFRTYVTYEGSEEGEEYNDEESLTVLAEDAEAAIERVKSHRIGKRQDWTDEDVDPPIEHKGQITSVKLVEVSHRIDVELA